MYFDKFWVSFHPCPKWHQLNREYRYYRKFHSVNHELKRYFADVELEREYQSKFVRRKRNTYWLNAWQFDKKATCVSTKSWKKLYKVRKQYLKPKYHDEDYYEIIEASAKKQTPNKYFRFKADDYDYKEITSVLNRKAYSIVTGIDKDTGEEKISVDFSYNEIWTGSLENWQNAKQSSKVIEKKFKNIVHQAIQDVLRYDKTSDRF